MLNFRSLGHPNRLPSLSKRRLSLYVIQTLAKPDFQPLTPAVDFYNATRGHKKRRAPDSSDVRRYGCGIYTVSPDGHHYWISASEGLCSLCVNSCHRRHCYFCSVRYCRRTITKFLALSKDSRKISCPYPRKIVDCVAQLGYCAEPISV